MRDSFKTKTINGVKTYFYNGKKVSKEIFDKQRAAAKQRQTEILGISKEDFKKEMMKKGGYVKKKRKRKPYKPSSFVKMKGRKRFI